MSNRYHEDWKLNQYYEKLCEFKTQLDNYDQFKQQFRHCKDVEFSDGVEDVIKELITHKDELVSEGININHIHVISDYGSIELVYYKTETQEEFTKRLEFQITCLQYQIDNYEKELSGVGK